MWNEILDASNNTAYIYREEDYEQIKQDIISKYYDVISQLLDTLSVRELI